MRLPMVVARGAGSVVFVLTLASAASLFANHSGVAAAGASAPHCNTGAIAISYGTTYTNDIGYTVSFVTLSGLDVAGCAGKTVEVTLTDASNTSLARGAAPGRSGSSTLTVPVSGAPAAKDVSGVHVAIG